MRYWVLHSNERNWRNDIFKQDSIFSSPEKAMECVYWTYIYTHYRDGGYQFKKINWFKRSNNLARDGYDYWGFDEGSVPGDEPLFTIELRLPNPKYDNCCGPGEIEEYAFDQQLPTQSEMFIMMSE